jgi:hypothetical protein
MNSSDSFLGKGWGFPPAFDKNKGEVEMLEGEPDIKSSLEILLSTQLGERVMQPTYGCNLDELVFESLTTTFATYIKNKIEVAILFFEPRININRIDIIPDNTTSGVLLIVVDYTVRTTNTRSNLVFPFYQNEGNSL